MAAIQPPQSMALAIDSRIAHYDVTALIGEGGMGQVYQATDTKLNRHVALKVSLQLLCDRQPPLVDRPLRRPSGADSDGHLIRRARVE